MAANRFDGRAAEFVNIGRNVVVASKSIDNIWRELMNFIVADNNNSIPGRFDPKIFISWLHN